MLWEWPGQDPTGGPCPTVEIQAKKLIWILEPDHDRRIPGDHAEQTFEDFCTYGPAWPQVPPGILSQLTTQPGLENPPWLNPGYNAYSPAWRAIEQGDEAAALNALAIEDPHRAFRHGTTLLMHAASHAMPAPVKLLLTAGANVNSRDEHGQSALAKAVRANTPALEIVLLLLEHGADQLDESLSLALNWKSAEVAEALLEHGARVSDPGALHTAAGKGWTSVVRRLIACGLDVNHHNSSGGTPLMWAKSLEIVELLVAAGGAVDAIAPNGATALASACAHGEKWKVEALLNAGADPNVPATDFVFGSLRGQPILHCLQKLRRDPEIVDLLLAAGAR